MIRTPPFWSAAAKGELGTEETQSKNGTERLSLLNLRNPTL